MPSIFIAEDDPLMISIYSQAFKLGGFEVNAAFDGEDAITKLQAMPVKPSVAVLDLMMPKKGGYDVLKAMKEDEKLKAIPVVILTNMSSESDLEKALSFGATTCLVKSNYSPSEILAQVKEVYNKYYPQNPTATA